MPSKFGGHFMTKVSIVRGASRGISFAIAKRLYKDGFKIGIHD
ncbi:hypothetical protein HMPREF1557_01100 [Streptococcus sobrinus W1703]|uniref:Uncharacterized protein n=2 Tax=Streptococcus sobrinus TaxID=1310 RepID=U2KN45_9STRE|nr:hypothetical protein HMPREF1557_01100 [Streptococcus sobrinus W1703]